MVDQSSEVLILQVLPDPDEDAEQLDDLTDMLREELLELDVKAVAPVMQDQAPEDAKGVVAALGGWLAIHFGPAGLRAVVNAVAAWAGRSGKTVEITLNGNTLKLTGTSADGRVSRGSRRWTIGIAKASVLPEPVGDFASTSRPASASGRTRDWMVNGSLMERAASASATGADTPSSRKDCCDKLFDSFCDVETC